MSEKEFCEFFQFMVFCKRSAYRDVSWFHGNERGVDGGRRVEGLWRDREEES